MESILTICVARNGDRAVRGRSEVMPRVKGTGAWGGWAPCCWRGASPLPPPPVRWCLGSYVGSRSDPSIRETTTPSERVHGFLLSWRAVVAYLCWQTDGHPAAALAEERGAEPWAARPPRPLPRRGAGLSLCISPSAVCLPPGPRCQGPQEECLVSNHVVERWACLEITSSDISDVSPFPCSRELHCWLLNTLFWKKEVLYSFTFAKKCFGPVCVSYLSSCYFKSKGLLYITREPLFPIVASVLLPTFFFFWRCCWFWHDGAIGRRWFLEKPLFLLGKNHLWLGYIHYKQY